MVKELHNSRISCNHANVIFWRSLWLFKTQTANVIGWGDVQHYKNVINHFTDFYLDCHLLDLRKWINSEILRLMSWSQNWSWLPPNSLEKKIWYWWMETAWSSYGRKRIFHTGDQYRCFTMCAVSWFATISHTLVDSMLVIICQYMPILTSIFSYLPKTCYMIHSYQTNLNVSSSTFLQWHKIRVSMINKATIFIIMREEDHLP